MTTRSLCAGCGSRLLQRVVRHIGGEEPDSDEFTQLHASIGTPLQVCLLRACACVDFGFWSGALVASSNTDYGTQPGVHCAAYHCAHRIATKDQGTGVHVRLSRNRSCCTQLSDTQRCCCTAVRRAERPVGAWFAGPACLEHHAGAAAAQSGPRSSCRGKASDVCRIAAVESACFVCHARRVEHFTRCRSIDRLLCACYFSMQWRVDVTISTSSLSHVLKPSILVQVRDTASAALAVCVT